MLGQYSNDSNPTDLPNPSRKNCVTFVDILDFISFIILFLIRYISKS